MIDLIDIMDFIDCRHIPYDGLGTIEEFKARIRLEYNRQRRDSPKLTVSFPPPPPNKHCQNLVCRYTIYIYSATDLGVTFQLLLMLCLIQVCKSGE